MRGWAKNASRLYKVERDNLLCTIHEHDIKAEVTHLSSTEYAAKDEVEDKLAKLLKEEEIHWAQYVKVRKRLIGHHSR